MGATGRSASRLAGACSSQDRPNPKSPAPFDICLPAGGWYDYWTGLLVAQSKFTEAPQLDKLPVFVRAGTILPRQPIVQSTAETPRGPLSLDVYPGPDCRGELFFDDGTSIGGANLRQQITCSATPTGVTLQFGREFGAYHPWWTQIAVTVHGWRSASARLQNGAPASADPVRQTSSFTIPDQGGPGAVTLETN